MTKLTAYIFLPVNPNPKGLQINFSCSSYSKDNTLPYVSYFHCVHGSAHTTKFFAEKEKTKLIYTINGITYTKEKYNKLINNKLKYLLRTGRTIDNDRDASYALSFNRLIYDKGITSTMPSLPSPEMRFTYDEVMEIYEDVFNGLYVKYGNMR